MGRVQGTRVIPEFYFMAGKYNGHLFIGTAKKLIVN